jgi:hypothetical protein
MPVFVSTAAVAARIRRRLRREGGNLRKCRETCRDRFYLGEFYTVAPSGFLDVTHVDLEDLGRELGVLKRFEAVTEQ